MQWLDQYAVDHWMPDFTPNAATGLDWEGLWRPFAVASPWWEKVLSIWTYPASVLVSGLVFAAGAVVLRRRGQPRAAVIWVAAWLVGNGCEYVGKRVLGRPALHWTHHGIRVAITSFHGSFPSGHTIRSLLVVALVVSLTRRALWPAVAWFVAVLVFLVVLADHTPSDILGGLCLGFALVVAVRAALETPWAQRPRSDG